MRILKATRYFVILGVIVVSFACASDGAIRMHLDRESTAALALDDGSSSLSVRTTADQTIVEVQGSTFIFSGHRGVRGDFGSAAGRLVIGRVTFAYDRASATYSGEYGRGEVELAARRTITIDQGGAAVE